MSGLSALHVRCLNTRGFLFDDGLLVAVVGIVRDLGPAILCLFCDSVFIL